MFTKTELLFRLLTVFSILISLSLSLPDRIYVINLPPVEIKATIPQVELMAHVVYSEARGEPELGQKYVAQVFINRGFNLKGFDGAANCSFYEPLDTAIYKLCKEVYFSPAIHDFTFFYNPDKATDKAFIRAMRNRKKVRIGNHLFFK